VKLGITGATGHVGGRVAAQLSGSGVPLRLIVRDPSRAPQLPGADVAGATYADAEAARRALEGVNVLFMVSAAESRERRAEHRTFIAAARAAGVEHIVYTSFIGAASEAVFTLGRDHGDAELAIRESGMHYTFLRDSFYSDVWPEFADPQGVIRGPAGDGRMAAVARADVADVATAVLARSEAHRDAIYHLTGPEAVTLTELAERASGALGRPLRFHNETVDEAYASRRPYGAERWQLDAWVSTYLAIAHGEVAAVSDDVPRLTGHPARTLEQAWLGQNP
jgi:NAD(P)H dehydrogenase (quinone)